MRYALIQNGVVTNVIEADPDHLPELPDTTMMPSKTAGIGWTYADGTFVEAPSAEPAPPSPRITRLAFRNRFTQAEKVALELAALDNPSATMAQRQQAAALRAHLKDLDSATFVDLNRPETVTAVQSLEAGGLLASGRAATILDVASITNTERPLQ